MTRLMIVPSASRSAARAYYFSSYFYGFRYAG